MLREKQTYYEVKRCEREVPISWEKQAYQGARRHEERATKEIPNFVGKTNLLRSKENRWDQGNKEKKSAREKDEKQRELMGPRRGEEAHKRNR